jgi:hypothetical protein
MSAIESITKALDIALNKFGTDNSIYVALENTEYEPVVETPYLASFVLNVGVSAADLGCSDVRDIIYQVDVNYASHVGSAPLNKMADLLNQTFKAGAYFVFNDVCVSVTSFEPTRIITNNGWATLPLTITCDSYTNKI